MKRVRFLADYRGVLTSERFYHAGDILDTTQEVAGPLIAAGRVEYIADISPTGDLGNMTLAELREVAQGAGVDHYWLKGRDTLLAELEKANEQT